MELTFTRSGGFAALPLAISGTVVFQDKAARVTSEAGYRRDLSPDEIRTVQTAAAALPEEIPDSGPGQKRDAYQYEIRITRDDRSVQKIVVHGESAPALQALLDWVRAECQRIWAHKTGEGAGK